MEKEIWKDVVGYEGLYLISNLGNVFHIKKKRLLKKSIREGYFRVWLFKKDSKKAYSVHRIVCEAFLENNERKPQVNNKNGIKNDNRLSNLEWCTHSENMRHALDTGLKIPKKMPHQTILALDKAMNKEVVDIITGQKYASTKIASDLLGIKRSTLIHYLLGTRNNKTNLRYSHLIKEMK